MLTTSPDTKKPCSKKKKKEKKKKKRDDKRGRGRKRVRERALMGLVVVGWWQLLKPVQRRRSSHITSAKAVASC